MKLQEEINKLENIKKKAVGDENYDLAKETNNKILKYKDIIQKIKDGKISPDTIIDDIDDIKIDNKNNTENKNKIEENKNKEINKDNASTATKRIVNKKKNVEKVSTGVSTNEKDNNRYMKSSELQSNSQFSPYHKSSITSTNNNTNNIINNSSKKEITDEDKDFINLIGQFLPEEIIYLLVSKNVKEIEKGINFLNEDLILYNNNGQYTLFMNGISVNDLVYTCSSISLQILKKNYITPKIQIVDILNILLDEKFREVIQVIKEFEDCLISLLDYLGDSNQKLREKVEKFIFEYAKKTKSGNKIINLIINIPIKKNLIKSRNHLNGRYIYEK